MADSRFDFPSIVVVKIAVRKDDKIFLIKEPETNSWMPGRWGLPGGKILLTESIFEALARKINTEIGFDVKVKGLIKIVNMPLDNRNVYQFIFQADFVNGKIDTAKIEAADAQWLDLDDIKKLKPEDYTEFYNKELLINILTQNFTIISKDLFLVQGSNNKKFVEWMNKV